MASLQITIELDDTGLAGYRHSALARQVGEDDACILGRVVQANQEAAGPRAEPVAVILHAVAAGIRSAENNV